METKIKKELFLKALAQLFIIVVYHKSITTTEDNILNSYIK